jgi:hypothetical protein
MLVASRCPLQFEGHPRHASEKESESNGAKATRPAPELENSRKFLYDLVEKRYNLVDSNILHFSIQKIDRFNDEQLVGIKCKDVDDVSKMLQHGLAGAWNVDANEESGVRSGDVIE